MEIPILAIDEVEFHKNDSVLYDEVLALRLGLIPFKTPKNMVLREECSCKGKGCSKCTIQMRLVKKSPGAIYSGDLKGKAEAVYEEMPIAEFKEEQEIEFIASLRLGKGKEHSKFSPGLVYYRNAAEIKILEDCKECANCIKECPQKVLKFEKGKIGFIDDDSKYKCDMCEACVESCNNSAGKKVLEIIPGKEIVFIIESWGQINAEEIFINSVRAIKENLKKFG